VVGVDAVVSETGMRILRIRYETASDRNNKTREVVALCQLKPGEAGEVVDIQRADRSVLQKLLAMAVIPGSTLKVEFTSPVVVSKSRIPELPLTMELPVKSEYVGSVKVH
jgi:hypothetical protein